MKKFFDGFTLGELLLCIGIIGIVSAMGMTIAKTGTDRAYNLYYYSAYENLYNAIADAKSKNIETNIEVLNHVKGLLAKSNLIALNSDIQFLSSKAYTINTNPCSLGYGYVNGRCVKLEHEADDKGMSMDKNNFLDKNSNLTQDQAKGDFTPGKKEDEKPNNNNNNSGTFPSMNDAKIETSSGVVYYYFENTSDGLNGFEALSANGITKAIPITMTIPQRKTRTNNGVAIVKLLYVDLGDGYLIPVSGDGSVDLQNRRDLLPAYIDDGIVGRNNNVVNRDGWKYRRPVYGTYKDAFCSLPNYASLNINNVINCSAGFNNISVGKSGVLKIENPRKAR